MKNASLIYPCIRQRSRSVVMKSGFTLIELLIVVAIIALLAALLFPVFARARENARRTACQSNEKQIALGLLQYAQDYDERLPFTANGAGLEDWFNDIMPYVKSLQIFRCPNAPRPAPVSSDNEFTTYCLPGRDLPSNPRLTIFKRDGLHLSQVKQPARTMMLLDSRHGSTDYVNGKGASMCQLNVPPESRSTVASTIHLDGYNVAFVDGHVKWIKYGTGNKWIYDLEQQDTL